MTAPSERFWEDLLLFIEDGKVIPVVGPELVTVDEGGTATPLTRWVARRLAQRLEVPEPALPPAYELNDVVSHYLRDGGEREGLYSRILKILRDGKLTPARPLRDLAGIPAFGLFVSLTFDSLLADAVTAARHGAPPDQLAYSTQTVADLPAPRGERTTPVVYQLLGRASSSPDFAICDEDLLEFVHALQDRQRQPLKLFDELRAHHLLFLGCGFSDWLTRFFLRTARGLELSQKRKRWDVLADAHAEQDPALAAFLSSFSADTKIVSLPAADFVAELARRWHEAHPESAPSAAAAAPAPGGESGPREGAVFVSYAKEDIEAAARLADGLRAAGLEVWFDRQALQLADDWALSIVRGIERCSLFLPVISQAALAEENRRRYFWREWNAASERARGMAPDEEFIVPVVVDDTRLDRTPLPDTFTRKQGPALPGGELTPDAARRLTEIVRNFHRRQRRS
jgi:hypothetical protein